MLDNTAYTRLLVEAASAPQPIDAATARHTHSQMGGQEGALHAFGSLYADLVAAEPSMLD